MGDTHPFESYRIYDGTRLEKTHPSHPLGHSHILATGRRQTDPNTEQREETSQKASMSRLIVKEPSCKTYVVSDVHGTAVSSILRAQSIVLTL